MTPTARILAVALPDEVLDALARRLGGVSVVSATSMDEAIAAARSNTFDFAVLSDAVADFGDASLRELKAAAGSRPFRVAVCVNAPHSADPVRSLGVTVERFFFRPFDADEIVRELSRSAGLELLPDAPPATDSASGAKQLLILWERFREPTLARIDVLENAALALLENKLSPGEKDAAAREAHKLAGSSGTFGFPRASTIARDLENRFTRPTEPPEAVAISELLLELRRELEGTPAAPVGTEVGERRDRRTVLIIDAEKTTRERLVMEAQGRGLEVVEAASTQSAREQTLLASPDAILIALPLGGDAAESLAFLEEASGGETPVATVAIAPRGSFINRIEIARAGVQVRLEHPCPPSSAIDSVLAAIRRARGDGGTVLVVDDDPQILRLMESILAGNGLTPATLADPAQFWTKLNEVDPDLVVLDVDMPRVSGIEICRALRADSRWTGLPIVFLTARSDSASVQRVFSAGADDFVGKPIIGSEVAMRINNRLERVRQIRELGETDPLTRVPTRKKSLELLRRFVKLARRRQSPLTISIVDVDRIKEINSTYGAGSGDDVLHVLARLLTQSLRTEDVVGRWGADEFVVAFVGSKKNEAASRLTGMIGDMWAKEFRADDGRAFHASFSAGVAEVHPDAATADSLIVEAEGALRTAGAGDERRVYLAGSPTEDGAPTVDIAVVEDDEALAGLLRHALKTAGYEVEFFDDGHRAVNALGGESPATRARLIMLDVDLPGLNGYDVLRRLGKDGVLKTAKVMMLTGRNAEADVLAGLGLGALDHINKPFSLPVLLRKISSALDSRAV